MQLEIKVRLLVEKIVGKLNTSIAGLKKTKELKRESVRPDRLKDVIKGEENFDIANKMIYL